MTGVTHSADTGRCVVHVDVDAFYAQCEEIRNPALRERPLGITQKYLLVTSNYPARRRGVTKLMGITEAQQICPDLVLVSGEDLTPYRQASKRILAVLQRFGVCERGGMDEMLVDVTAEAQNRALQGSIPAQWAAHVHSNKVALVQDNKHRPMDLRALALRGAITAVTAAGPEPPTPAWQPSGQPWEPLLMAGCVIAQEMRAALKAEVGFRCSAGISSNRMLAKLVSGLHKPDDQTVLLPPDASTFVAPLPIRALPGVGFKIGNELTRMEVKTAADLRRVSQEKLMQKFGERIGTFLYLACRGQDPSRVQDKGPPKSITVEDSFKDCSSLPAAQHVIKVLAPDLLARMIEDYQETGRHASTLTLKWRHRGSGWGRSSSSCPTPTPLLSPQVDNPSQVSMLGNTLMNLLKKNLTEPFQLTLLNIGVTNFAGAKGVSAGGKAGWNPAFAKLLGPQAKKQKLGPPATPPLPLNGAQDSRSAALKSLNQRRNYGAQPVAACISKSTERALREEGRGHPPASSSGHQLDALDWQEEEQDLLHGDCEDEDVWVPRRAREAAFQQPYLSVAQQASSSLALSPVQQQRAVQCQQEYQQQGSAAGLLQHACLQLPLQPQQQPQQHYPQLLGEVQSQQSQQQLPQQQAHQPSSAAPDHQTVMQQQQQQQQQQQPAPHPALSLDAGAQRVAHQQPPRRPPPPNPSLPQPGIQSNLEAEGTRCHSRHSIEGNSRQVAWPAQSQQAELSQVPQQLLSERQVPGRVSDTHDLPLFGRRSMLHSSSTQNQNSPSQQSDCERGLDGQPQQHVGSGIDPAGCDAVPHIDQSRQAHVQTSDQASGIVGVPAAQHASNRHTESTQPCHSGVAGCQAVHVPNTEQSDFELAMRLQEQEHALQRQSSRPVLTGRLGLVHKPRQASGTLHAFFKKA